MRHCSVVGALLIGPRAVAFARVLPNSLHDLLDTRCDVALFPELRLGDLGPQAPRRVPVAVDCRSHFAAEVWSLKEVVSCR